MNRFIVSLVGAALFALGVLATPASAGTIYNPIYTPQLGVNDTTINPQINAGIYTAGHKLGSHHSFSDTLSFTANAATNIVLKILTFGSISYDFTLTNNATNAILTKQSFSNGTIRGKTGFIVTDLLTLSAAGTWVLKITGTGCTCSGYVLSIANAAVTPIPAPVVLFLTSLLGLGGLAWRRRAMNVVVA
jgi:hypothetical protein